MAQNVFMASMAFVIPLNKIKRRYRISNKCKELRHSFVQYPDFRCQYWFVKGKKYDIISIDSKPFFFKSRYNSKDFVWREIEVKPLMLEIDFGKGKRKQYSLILFVQIDKIFKKASMGQYDRRDFCTEFDLVNMKKAFFERYDYGLHADMQDQDGSFYDWLMQVLWEIEGQRRNNVRLSYSVIDICVQNLNVTSSLNSLDNISKEFQEKYYDNQSENPIKDYLDDKILLLQANGATEISGVCERHFVYGLLYANDNFLMADKATIDNIVENSCSNSKVEKYWADDESIVHIKINSPHFYVEQKKEMRLSCNLQSELQCLTEMNILIFIKRKLHRFKERYKRLSSKEIEDECGKISKLLDDKMFNQVEMDRRMDYFIKQFRLHDMFENIKGIATSRKNSLEISFIHNSNIWILVISTLTLIVTILSFFLTK